MRIFSTLSKAQVDEAVEGTLQPDRVGPQGMTVRIFPYDGMAFRDRVFIFIGDDYVDDLPVLAFAVGRELTFTVPRKEIVTASYPVTLPVHYEVQRYLGFRDQSQILDLTLTEAL